MGRITAVSPYILGHAAVTALRGDGGGQTGGSVIGESEARRCVPTVAAVKHHEGITATRPAGRRLGEGEAPRSRAPDRIGPADVGAVSSLDSQAAGAADGQ